MIKQNVGFVQDIDTIVPTDYSEVEKLLDEEHVYSLSWIAQGDRSGMGSGYKERLTKEELLEDVQKLASFGDNLTITPISKKLGKTIESKLDPVHRDERRIIYDPEQITKGLGGKWYALNIMKVNEMKKFDESRLLGKHHHEYGELFLVLEGLMSFITVDPAEPKRQKTFFLGGAENRLYIPEGIDHVAFNPSNKHISVMGTYGTQKFNPKGLIDSDEEVLGTLIKSVKRLF